MKPDLVDEPSSSASLEPLERRRPVGVHDVEHALGQAAVQEELGERLADAGAYSAGFHTTVLPQSSAGTRYQDGTATGKLPGRDDRRDADRLRGR